MTAKEFVKAIMPKAKAEQLKQQYKGQARHWTIKNGCLLVVYVRSDTEKQVWCHAMDYLLENSHQVIEFIQDTIPNATAECQGENLWIVRAKGYNKSLSEGKTASEAWFNAVKFIVKKPKLDVLQYRVRSMDAPLKEKAYEYINGLHKINNKAAQSALDIAEALKIQSIPSVEKALNILSKEGLVKTEITFTSKRYLYIPPPISKDETREVLTAYFSQRKQPVKLEPTLKKLKLNRSEAQKVIVLRELQLMTQEGIIETKSNSKGQELYYLKSNGF